MDTLYLIALFVGGFFVLLSIFGGLDGDAAAEIDIEVDYDVEADADVDAGGDAAADSVDARSGLVDLYSVRALFLFAAFFGLTGVALSFLDVGEPWTSLCATLVGLLVGLGGNYVIQRVGYAHVSSDISSQDLKGLTARVLIPFEGPQKGKIGLITRGHRLQLVARGFEEIGAFSSGDEVVIVRMRGAIAEVVKPD